MYVFNAATKLKKRYSLNTPSWAEAQRLASDKLRGLDPEIAAARQVIEKRENGRCSIADGCQMWVERSIARSGKKSSTTKSYISLKTFVTAWADREGLINVQDIASADLLRWQTSSDWQKLAQTTRSQRWGVIRSLFSYLERCGVIDKSPASSIEREKKGRFVDGHVQAPYTDAQMKKILSGVEKIVPFNLPYHQRPTYIDRVRVFIRLLEGVGCDVSDAIQFRPAMLKTAKVGKKNVHVYRYQRQKTGVLAVVPIDADLAKILKTPPMEPGANAAMPFRMPGLDLKMDQKKWSNRVLSAIAAAGITHVDLPDGSKHSANVKQFRHTAAVRWLREGQRPEEVAKMLGHVDTDMVRKHYAPWVQELDESHIRRVVERWK